MSCEQQVSSLPAWKLAVAPEGVARLSLRQASSVIGRPNAKSLRVSRPTGIWDSMVLYRVVCKEERRDTRAAT